MSTTHWKIRAEGIAQQVERLTKGIPLEAWFGDTELFCKSFAGHRNRIENNRIVDSGSTNGVAIDVQGATEAVVLSGNEIIETRQPADRVAVRLGAETRAIEVRTNQITGFATAVKQLSTTTR